MLITTKLLQRKFIFISFFISGLSGITYQIIWERVLQRFVGTALTAVAIITAIFMTGFCLGAQLARSASISSGRWTDYLCSLTKKFQPFYSVNALVRIYFFSLAALAILGFIYVVGQNGIFACLSRIVTTSLALLNLTLTLRLLLACSFLLLPASFLGMSLPILSQYFANQNCQNASSQLYRANVLGSTCGAALTCFFFLPNLGITRSIAVAAAFYLGAALLILPLLKSSSGNKLSFEDNTAKTETLNTARGLADSVGEFALVAHQTDDESAQAQKVFLSDEAALSTHLAGSIVAFSGFLSFFLQMVFIRLFMLVFGSCSYAFTLVLVNELAALSLGASLSIKLCGQTARGRLSSKGYFYTLMTICLLAAFWLYLFLFWLNDLPWLVYIVQICFAQKLGLEDYQAFILSRVIISILVVFFPLTLLGILFPSALSCIRRRSEETASVIGKLYVLNTIGAISGCLFGGLWIIPTLANIGRSGIQLSLVGASICLFVFASYLAKQTLKIGSIPVALLGVSIIAFCTLSVPSWDSSFLSSGISFLSIPNTNCLARDKFKQLLTGKDKSDQAELLYYKEGSNAIVTVSQIEKRNIIFLKTDGKMEAALPLNTDLPAPTSDRLTHVLLGSLPLLLSEGKPENVLLIGYGTGVTSGAILNSREVQHLHIAEAEKAVLQSSTFFRNSVSNYEELASGLNQHVGRVTFTCADGRNFLSMLNQHYQVIVVQAGEPWLEGCADLYTLEFWQLARRRLSLGGVFCQWIPLYGIDKPTFAKICLTFQSAFSHAVMFQAKQAGEVLLIGFNTRSNQTAPRINIAQVERRFQAPLMHKEFQAQAINTVVDLLSMMAFTPKTLRLFLDDEKREAGLKLVMDDQLSFTLPTLLARQRMSIAPELYHSLKASPFSTEDTFCAYGTNNCQKVSFIAQLAKAYRTGESCNQSSSVAQALIEQQKTMAGNKY